jgi:hypothetical protein
VIDLQAGFCQKMGQSLSNAQPVQSAAEARDPLRKQAGSEFSPVNRGCAQLLCRAVGSGNGQLWMKIHDGANGLSAWPIAKICFMFV